jgi:hypothetical protein
MCSFLPSISAFLRYSSQTSLLNSLFFRFNSDISFLIFSNLLFCSTPLSHSGIFSIIFFSSSSLTNSCEFLIISPIFGFSDFQSLIAFCISGKKLSHHHILFINFSIAGHQITAHIILQDAVLHLPHLNNQKITNHIIGKVSQELAISLNNCEVPFQLGLLN